MALRQKIDRLLSRVESLGLWVSILALVLAGLLVLLAVPARQLPWLQIPDSYLFVKLLMLTAIALALGQVTGRGHHISVDLIYVRFSPRVRRIARFGALIAGLILFAPLAWWYGGLAVEMFERGRTQPGLLRLPRWPLYAIMCAGFALVTVRLMLLIALGAPETDTHPTEEH